jgi:LacI family transcriptional regulator
MNRTITAKTIAARLGISQPTVSRALSPTQGHLVAPDTRERILEMARQMGYRPNAAARSLRSRRTNVVGFYSGYGYLAPGDDFLTHMIGGLQRACDGRGVDLLLHGVYRGRSTDDIFAELMDGRVDGLFMHTSPDDPLAGRIAAEAALPVVAVADALPGIASVICDDASGMRLLLERLWHRGHRRIAFVAPERALTSVETRRAAYEAFVRERGQEATIIRCAFDGFVPALDRLRAVSAPPTAVCCWNDMFAYGLLRTCRAAGVAVPETLAVAGFDGFLDTKFPAAQLTTVVAPWEAVAEQAAALLFAHLGGEPVPLRTELPVSLYEGDTA